MNNGQGGYYRARKRDKEKTEREAALVLFFVLSAESVETHKRKCLYSQVYLLGFSPYNLTVFNTERMEKT